MTTRARQAVGRFGDGFNCSQAVLGSYSQDFGLDSGQAAKVATGFGGGMHIDSVCGAVTGAFMVLGLKYGNAVAEDQEAKVKTYEKVVEFTGRFKDRNDSVMCKDLLGCDITSPEGMSKAKENKLFGSVCPRMIRDAIEILEEMLAKD